MRERERFIIYFLMHKAVLSAKDYLFNLHLSYIHSSPQNLLRSTAIDSESTAVVGLCTRLSAFPR